MEINKQQQQAGEHSTQIQAENVHNTYNITNINGIDEQRARAICKEEYKIACQNWTREAILIANERVHKLEDRLIPKMQKYDETLKAFADPSFQFTLRNAQVSAASSERDDDYEMLAELLLHRVEYGKDREKRLGISKAIEIVDKVSEEALRGLACFYAVVHLNIEGPIIEDGLSLLNSLYGNLLKDKELPVGYEWLEHLDLLSAIRIGINGINSFKKMKEIMPNKLSQYFECGVRKGSEELRRLREEFNNCGIPANCLIQHPLKEDFLFLNIPNDLEQMCLIRNLGSTTLRIPLNVQQKNIMVKAMAQFKNKEIANDENMNTKFMQCWDRYCNLKK